MAWIGVNRNVGFAAHEIVPSACLRLCRFRYDELTSFLPPGTVLVCIYFIRHFLWSQISGVIMWEYPVINDRCCVKPDPTVTSLKIHPSPTPPFWEKLRIDLLRSLNQTT